MLAQRYIETLHALHVNNLGIIKLFVRYGVEIYNVSKLIDIFVFILELNFLKNKKVIKIKKHK